MGKKKKGFIEAFKEKKGFEKPMFILIKIAKWWLIIGLLFTAFAWSYFKVAPFKKVVKEYVPKPAIEFLLKDVVDAGRKK